MLGSGFVFSDDPALCAQLRVAKRTDLPVFCLNAVPDPDDVSGLLPPLSRDGLFVTDRDVNPNDLYDCERISTAGRETIRRAGRALRIFQVHHCRNYRGLRESGSPNPSDDPLVLPNEAKPEDAALPAVPEPFIPPDAVPAQDRRGSSGRTSRGSRGTRTRDDGAGPVVSSGTRAGCSAGTHARAARTRTRAG